MGLFAEIYVFLCQIFIEILGLFANFFCKWPRSPLIRFFKVFNIIVFGAPYVVYKLAYAISISAIFVTGKVVVKILNLTIILIPVSIVVGFVFGFLYYVVDHAMCIIAFPFLFASNAILDAMLKKSGEYYGR